MASATTELDVDLPKGVIKRIVKAKLAERQAQAHQRSGDFQVSKDAVSAFSQATKVFITYVTTAAYDICRENKRTTVAPQDILQALNELEFGSFIDGLEERLLGVPAAQYGQGAACWMPAAVMRVQQISSFWQAYACLHLAFCSMHASRNLMLLCH